MKQENFNVLKNIKRVEVSESVYGKIVQRIESRKNTTIPFYKVGIAACLLIGLIIAQLFILSKPSGIHSAHLNQPTEWVEINNNTLYYE